MLNNMTTKTEIQIISFYEETQFDIQVVVKDTKGELVSDEYVETYKTSEEANEAARKVQQEYPESIIVRLEGVE